MNEKKDIHFVKRAIEIIILLVIVNIMLITPVYAQGIRIFLSSNNGKNADIFVNIDNGAVDPLGSGYEYSRDEILAMLKEFSKVYGNKVDFTEAIDDVYAWHEENKGDIAALIAIAVMENGDMEHFNFFNMPAAGDHEYYISQSVKRWDLKSECKTLGKALSASFDRINKNYWEKGQDSFYKMQFAEYGYPQGKDLADANKIKHSYLPWWEDTRFTGSGYMDKELWCNKAARIRENLLKNIEAYKTTTN